MGGRRAAPTVSGAERGRTVSVTETPDSGDISRYALLVRGDESPQYVVHAFAECWGNEKVETTRPVDLQLGEKHRRGSTIRADGMVQNESEIIQRFVRCCVLLRTGGRSDHPQSPATRTSILDTAAAHVVVCT